MERKKTPGWKIVLGFVGVALFGCVAVIGGVAWWIHANKDRLLAEGKKSEDEATVFAATHDQTECIDESMRKLAQCRGFECELTGKLFLSYCLPNAEPTAGLCEGVPKPTEFVSAGLWTNSECERRGKKGNPRCPRLLQTVPEFCAKKQH